jgi:hypothetical protein
MTNAPVHVWRTVCLMHRIWMALGGWDLPLHEVGWYLVPHSGWTRAEVAGRYGFNSNTQDECSTVCTPCTAFLRHSWPGSVPAAAPALEPDAAAHERWRLKNAFLLAAAPSLWNESQHNACGKNRLGQLVTTSVVAAQDHGDAQSQRLSTCPCH